MKCSWMGEYRWIRELLFRLEPERAHRLTLQLLALAGAVPALRSGLSRIFSSADTSLRVRVFGLDFANPVGLAAGYDKDGLAMHGLACLGFGHLELGTVTLEPQEGNPRPRVFRLVEDRALINRMGFPNMGAKHLLDRLQKRPEKVVLGVNIGKSAATPIEEAGLDYVKLMRHFYSLADYLAINISSPNTVGLRELQGRRFLELLLNDLADSRAQLRSSTGHFRPLLVKLAPDLTDAEFSHALEVIEASGMDGAIVSNTTIARDGLRSSYRGEAGGLSGIPLLDRSTDLVRQARSLTDGGLPVIAAGGIFGPQEAAEKLNAGASLIQIFTGMVYQGPGIVKEILTGIR